ncbi:MAG: hypothetical protein HOI53_08930 [Francisellaceae bacterium]|jgi:hypothetical protein|nr:hypothetical protein [Francisellaceae bacterium]MBT6208138.1 hypothetical protein [Francisellaceae bacterium]MBT6539927.1 hypothetical protein [Francisellaceae bacterium]
MHDENIEPLTNKKSKKDNRTPTDSIASSKTYDSRPISPALVSSSTIMSSPSVERIKRRYNEMSTTTPVKDNDGNDKAHVAPKTPDAINTATFLGVAYQQFFSNHSAVSGPYSHIYTPQKINACLCCHMKESIIFE